MAVEAVCYKSLVLSYAEVGFRFLLKFCYNHVGVATAFVLSSSWHKKTIRTKHLLINIYLSFKNKEHINSAVHTCTQLWNWSSPDIKHGMGVYDIRLFTGIAPMYYIQVDAVKATTQCIIHQAQHVAVHLQVKTITQFIIQLQVRKCS